MPVEPQKEKIERAKEQALISDYNSLFFDLGNITKKITEADKELKVKLKEIEDTKIVFDNKRIAIEKSLEMLNSSILEKRKEKDFFDNEIIGIRKNIESIKKEKEFLINDLENRLLNLSKDEIELEKDIKESQIELENNIVKVKNYKEESLELEKEIAIKVQLKKENTELYCEIKARKEELVELEKKKKDYMNLFDELNEFRESLKETEKKLTRKEIDISIMTERLKPRYIKVFKQFSNL